jgi:hypothetical protein
MSVALRSHLFYNIIPLTLDYLWDFGSLSGFFLIIQTISGLFLSMHYTVDTVLVFDSQHIMRNVNLSTLVNPAIIKEYYKQKGYTFKDIFSFCWSFFRHASLAIFCFYAVALIYYSNRFVILTYWGFPLSTSLFNSYLIIYLVSNILVFLSNSEYFDLGPFWPLRVFTTLNHGLIGLAFLKSCGLKETDYLSSSPVYTSLVFTVCANPSLDYFLVLTKAHPSLVFFNELTLAEKTLAWNQYLIEGVGVCSVLASVQQFTQKLMEKKNTEEEWAVELELTIQTLKDEQASLRDELNIALNQHQNVTSYFWPTVIVLGVVSFCYFKGINPIKVIQDFWNQGIDEPAAVLTRQEYVLNQQVFANRLTTDFQSSLVEHSLRLAQTVESAEVALRRGLSNSGRIKLLWDDLALLEQDSEGMRQELVEILNRLNAA